MIQYSPNNSPPSIDVVRRWNRAELLAYLSPLLDEDDQKIFREAKVSGNAFLMLDANQVEKLGLLVGLTTELIMHIRQINGELASDSPAFKRLKSASDGANYFEKIIKKFKPNSRVHEAFRPYVYYADQTKNNSSLINAIVHDSYISMYGPRASGKSSRTVEAMQTLGSMGYKCFYVDLQTVPRSNQERFWSVVGKRVELPNEIDSWEGFLKAFTKSKDSPRLTVIFFDEFDVLLKDESKDLLSPLLSALRGARDDIDHFTIRSAIAIGTFAVTRLVQNDPMLSPFNSMQGFSGISLTKEQVEGLFQEFAADRGITIDPPVIDDIYQLTNGHAGMVNICGAAIDDTVLEFSKGQTYDLARWYSLIPKMLRSLLSYGTFSALVETLKDKKDAVDYVRLKFLGKFDEFITPVNETQVRLARFLAALGVLTPDKGGSEFKMSSPMIDLLLRKCVIPVIYPVCPSGPVPKIGGKSGGPLDCLETLKEAVKVFDKDLIKRAAARAFKTAPVKVDGDTGAKVPRESIYDSELSRILSNWLTQENYEVTGQWHHVGKNHKYSDIVIDNGAYKFVFELLATGSKSFIKEHIERAEWYKRMMHAKEAWVIHFTCEDDYLGHPLWQSDTLLDDNINVVHIRHDLEFTNVTMSAKVKDRGIIEKECIISE